MENKYSEMAWEVNRDWTADHNDAISYAGTYKTACGVEACWALVSTYCGWLFVDGIDSDFEVVEDEEEGELGVVDYYGSCGYDTLLEATLDIRRGYDANFTPDCEELLHELDRDDEIASAKAALEAGVPLADILA